jgi:hypothetical protein
MESCLFIRAGCGGFDRILGDSKRLVRCSVGYSWLGIDGKLVQWYSVVHKVGKVWEGGGWVTKY